ncbi:MAG: putative porin [Muribaculaceae bacterium]|nr:putative porin [Muribaculaceae bacterium]
MAVVGALIASATLAFPQGSQSLSRNFKEGNATQTVKKDTIKEGSAWTLTFPLADHVESQIDTLTYNYQRYSIPALQSDAYVTTGNLGAEGINMIYFERPERFTFFFRDALDRWLPSFAKQKFYNVYVPSTILQYGFAGSKETHQDLLNIDLMGNVNRRIGIGGKTTYLHSRGTYENQAVKNFSWGLSFYYLGDRYEAQAFYNNYYTLLKENGGITDDLYITDPAQVQAGVTSVNTKSIPTWLNYAQSRMTGDEFYMNHAYKMGYWKSVAVNDTLTREEYVPLAKIIYSFDLQHNRHGFKNTNANEGNQFWEHRYLNTNGTLDDTYMNMMTNTIGLELIEGFRKWVKFGLSAYISYQIQKYHQTSYYYPIDEEQADYLTPLPEGLYVPPSATKNFLWVGGRFQKDKGNILRYSADVKFGLIGDGAGDIDLNGYVSTKIPVRGDSIKISAEGHFSSLSQPYLLQQYISNHFVWSNNFGKSRKYKIGGNLHIPWTKTTINVGLENIQNYVYFNSGALPQQYGGNVQVFSASLNQQLRLGILHWNNSIYYQKTSNSDILPLPELAIYSNLFIKFIAFKVLKVQLGVDCDYYTSYKSLNYQPATMSFHVQGSDPVKVGNYPLINAYVNARLYKTRFYVQYSHINQGWFSSNYFFMPHYPMNPRRLELGLSIDFTN